MNRTARYLLILYSLLAIYLPDIANAQPKFNIDHYNTEDGLSHDMVTCIFKDKEGFMWFGTPNGLNRFDGNRFVTFKSSPGDLSQLANTRVEQVVEDDFLHLWIRTADGQVYRFDKRTGQFFPLSAVLQYETGAKYQFKQIITISKNEIWLETMENGLLMLSDPSSNSMEHVGYNTGAIKNFALPSNKINFFKEDGAGRIWVGSPKGVICLVKDKSGIYRNNGWGFVSDSTNFTCMADGGGKLYFGTTKGRQYVFDTLTKQYEYRKRSSFRLNDMLVNRAGTRLFAVSSSGELLVTDLKTGQTLKYLYNTREPLSTLFEDRKGNIWIKPTWQGALRFSPSSTGFSTYQPLYTGQNNSGDYFRVFEDSSGKVWVNLKGGGFGYYNPAKDAIENFYRETSSPNRLLSNIVRSVYYDPAGTLWLLTGEPGIEKISFQQNNFNLQSLSSPGAFPADNEVRAVFKDRKNRLWVGAESGNLYVLENGKPLANLFYNFPKNGLGQVNTIMQAKNGAIWLGTKANGLYKAVPLDLGETKYRLFRYRHNPENPNSLSSNQVYSLVEDSAGRVWIGSFDNGLNLLMPGMGDSIFIHDRDYLSEYPKSGFRNIRHMALDKQGNLWLATTDGLLVAGTAQPGTCRFAAYQKVPGDIESLGNNDIQYILRDSGNNMWLATSGGGLNQAIGNDPLKALEFKVFTTSQGLANDYTISCVEDDKQQLWVATQAGLSRFDPQHSTFRNFNSNNGLPHYAFSEAATAKMADGRLVFGTQKGLLSFYPDSIADHTIPARIVFTNLQVNNKDAVAGGIDSILKYSINYTNAITLRHDQNNISIDYTVPDYRSGGKQVYAYRLQGFDTGWRNNDAVLRAIYTNLPPGHYLFEVKCLNNELYSNEPAKSLHITIEPHPWKTGRAYTLYLILAALVLLVVWRTSLTMLRTRQKLALEKKLAELKLNFFTNVSQELRTPLTLITNPIEEIQKNEPLTEKGRQDIEAVCRNTASLKRFVSQLLELRKLQGSDTKLIVTRVDLLSFVKRIGGYFADVSREKKINFSVEAEPGDWEAWIDMDKIETVVHNLLDNAFKFTPGGKSVTLYLKKDMETDDIVLEVSDEGPGVPNDQLEKIFDLFYEGGEAGWKNGKGKGVGLALSKVIMQMHSGSVVAFNNRYGGLTVSVNLPTETDHFDGEEVNSTAWVDEQGLSDKEIQAKNQASDNHVGAAVVGPVPLILLVVNDAELKASLHTLLSRTYRIEVAGNGVEGLEMANELLPDLVLSDMIMPKMDGIKMLNRLKKNIATSHIPVVLLIDRIEVENRLDGLEYGADYYITKPFEEEFFSAAIHNLAGKRKKLLEAMLEDKMSMKPEPGSERLTSLDEFFLNKILAIVKEKMPDPQFNIDKVAESISMVKATFHKKFKALTGLAPSEFVHEMRLKRAKHYLDTEFGNIPGIAYASGFRNPRHFSASFKAKYQITPSEYLKKKNNALET